jgi:hypothetical protein
MLKTKDPGENKVTDVKASTVPGFPNSESLIAPVIVGVHRDNSPIDYLKLAVDGAISAIPTVRTQLNVLFQGKKQVEAVEHLRRPFSGTDKSGAFIIRLCDQRPGESFSDVWPRWRWEVSCKVLDYGEQPVPIPGVSTTLSLAVTRFQLNEGRIDSAIQLALFRHLWVQGLRGVDPQLVVGGGHHDWDVAWWSTALENQV